MDLEINSNLRHYLDPHPLPDHLVQLPPPFSASGLVASVKTSVGEVCQQVTFQTQPPVLISIDTGTKIY